jgi:ABC-type glycerol-3-phosphate transport system substrate-binding protein
MRVRIAGAVAGALLVALACGCGVRAKKATRLHVVVWSGWVGVEEEAFERMVSMFNASQDRYQFQNFSTVEEDTRIFRAITAGTPPDLFFLWNTSYIGALAANGAIQPLDGLLRKWGLREDDFVPGALDQARYRGRLYGVPFLVDASAFYWNRDVFAEAGVDPNRPPRTLEELLDLAVKLTKRDAHGNLVRLGFQPPPVHEVLGLFGGRLADPATGRITANDPRNVEALEWYARMFELQGGGLRIDSFQQGFGNFDSPNHQFFVGKVAMMFSGEWWPGYVTRYSPTTDYGVVQIPYPSKHPEMNGSTFMGGNFACIATECKHPDAAVAFIKWMSTRKAQIAFSKIMHNVPDVRSALLAPELTQGNREKRAFGAVCRIVALGKPTVYPPTPVNVAYMSELETAAQRVVRHTATPRQALDQVQRRLEMYMEPYRGM